MPIINYLILINFFNVYNQTKRPHISHGAEHNKTNNPKWLLLLLSVLFKKIVSSALCWYWGVLCAESRHRLLRVLDFRMQLLILLSVEVACKDKVNGFIKYGVWRKAAQTEHGLKTIFIRIMMIRIRRGKLEDTIMVSSVISYQSCFY